MKQQIQDHYQNIRDAINKNIETIQALINQADSLQRLAESLSADTGAQGEIVENLRKEIAQINQTILQLIKETESLFKLYNDFVNTVVQSK